MDPAAVSSTSSSSSLPPSELVAQLERNAKTVDRVSDSTVQMSILRQTKELIDKGFAFTGPAAENLNKIAMAGKKWKVANEGLYKSGKLVTERGRFLEVIERTNAGVLSAGALGSSSSSSSSSGSMSSGTSGLSPQLSVLINRTIADKAAAESQLTQIEAFIDARSSRGGFSPQDKMSLASFAEVIGNWEETLNVSGGKLDTLLAKIGAVVNPSAEESSAGVAPPVATSSSSSSPDVNFSKLMSYADRVDEMTRKETASSIFVEIALVLDNIQLPIAITGEQATKLSNLRDEIESWHSEIVGGESENKETIDKSISKLEQIIKGSPSTSAGAGAGVSASEASKPKPGIWNAWGLFGR